MHTIILFIVVLSGLHIVFGIISFITGIVATLQALVWIAHTVSPIWSGFFFIICGLAGLLCCKKKTQYSILCYTGISAVTVITAVINMQLLRLGLVNYTTIGKTFQKENKDKHIIVALIIGGCECLVCLISTFASLKIGYDAKHNKFKSNQKAGTFFVQVVGEKEIVVVRSKPSHLQSNNLNIAAAHSLLNQANTCRNSNNFMIQAASDV